MTEEILSMKNGLLQFSAEDFEPIPYTDKIRTRPEIYGMKIEREAISLLARYWERFGIDASQIGVAPKVDIYQIHNEKSPGPEYLSRHVKENAFNRAVMKYVALFQKELRRSKGVPLEGSVIEAGVTVTFPDDIHAVQANSLISEMRKLEMKDSKYKRSENENVNNT